MASCGISSRGVGMGIGTIGSNPNMVIKRKFRWTLEWVDEAAFKLIIPESFVKLAARPNVTFEETNILDNNNRRCWIPGKANWEEVIVTYFDVINDEGGALFAYWMAQQYQRTANEPLKIEPASAILRLYDGCGNPIETWHLDNAIVTNLNFGDLDYIQPDPMLEATIRYSRVTYENNCENYFSGADPMFAPAAAPPPAWHTPGPPAAPQI